MRCGRIGSASVVTTWSLCVYSPRLLEVAVMFRLFSSTPVVFGLKARHLFTANVVELRLLPVLDQVTFSALPLAVVQQVQAMQKTSSDHLAVLGNACFWIFMFFAVVLYYKSHPKCS